MKVETNLRLTNNEKIILGIGEVGRVTLDIFFPKTYSSKTWLGRLIFNLDNERSAQTTMWRLKRKGLVTKDKNKKFILTLKGRNEYERIKRRVKSFEPKRWDGRWRLVVFDIPEKYRSIRDVVRCELLDAGFKNIQKSVWIGPSALGEQFIEWLGEHYFRKYFFMFTIDTIDREFEIKRLFDIPNSL